MRLSRIQSKSSTNDRASRKRAAGFDSTPASLKLADGRVVKFPAVMGVLNVTPDSFSDGGKYFDPDRAVEHALAMEADCAGARAAGQAAASANLDRHAAGGDRTRGARSGGGDNQRHHRAGARRRDGAARGADEMRSSSDAYARRSRQSYRVRPLSRRGARGRRVPGSARAICGWRRSHALANYRRSGDM